MTNHVEKIPHYVIQDVRKIESVRSVLKSEPMVARRIIISVMDCSTSKLNGIKWEFLKFPGRNQRKVDKFK